MKGIRCSMGLAVSGVRGHGLLRVLEWIAWIVEKP